RQPRLPRRSRGAELPAQLGQGVRADHRDGHPRPGRRQLRRPGGVPRRRADRHRAVRSHPGVGAGHDEATGRPRRGGGLMLRITIRNLLARKLRLLLSGLAVVLGVMFVAGAFVLTDTLGPTFDAVFATAYSEIDVVVRGEAKLHVNEFEGENVPSNLPASLVDKVSPLPGEASANGVVASVGARVIGKNGKALASYGPPQLGGNWVDSDTLIDLREGRAPTKDDEIVVNAAVAKAAKLSVGDRVGVLTLEPKREFTVVGIYGYSGGRDSIGGVQEVLFTTPVAQRLML